MDSASLESKITHYTAKSKGFLPLEHERFLIKTPNHILPLSQGIIFSMACENFFVKIHKKNLKKHLTKFLNGGLFVHNFFMDPKTRDAYFVRS